MDTISLKIDRTTLPKDGQKVKWQTQEDFDNKKWKEGIFVDGEDMFSIGFENVGENWDYSWSVLHWSPL